MFVRCVAVSMTPQLTESSEWHTSQIAALPLVIGAAAFLLHEGGGLYWLAPGLILPLIASMINAWVLLVEILR